MRIFRRKNENYIVYTEGLSIEYFLGFWGGSSYKVRLLKGGPNIYLPVVFNNWEMV